VRSTTAFRCDSGAMRRSPTSAISVREDPAISAVSGRHGSSAARMWNRHGAQSALIWTHRESAARVAGDAFDR
jgi:hypothetical protein